MADVGNPGIGVLRHDDARRDVGPAVLGAVGRDRKARDVDLVLAQHIEELAKVLIGHLDLRKHGAPHGHAGKLARYYLPGPNAAQIRARPETRCRIEWWRTGMS